MLKDLSASSRFLYCYPKMCRKSSYVCIHKFPKKLETQNSHKPIARDLKFSRLRKTGYFFLSRIPSCEGNRFMWQLGIQMALLTSLVLLPFERRTNLFLIEMGLESKSFCDLQYRQQIKPLLFSTVNLEWKVSFASLYKPSQTIH